jgi:hypothetical protein
VFLRWLLSIVAIALAGCADPCANSILAEVPSPDNSHRAVVFERSCGATTSFSAQVSVLNSRDRQPRDGGNVFVADNNHGAARHLQVTVRWSAPDRLVILYPESARIFRREVSIDGITIAYEAAP